MLEICALASGSNGNCYYLGNENTAVLIDAGLSARQIQLRMTLRNIPQEKVKAIFISHEHSDHCRGARVLSKRLRIPVYLTRKTFLAIRKAEQPELVEWFEAGDSTQLDELTIHSFLKNHDAVEACSFRVSYSGKEVGVMTDIGEPCERVKEHLSKCHAVFIESNYDEEMLLNGPYPYFLKRRVSSGYGHMSNEQSVQLVKEHAGDNLQTVLLSHLSGENNTPEKANEAFSILAEKYNIILTSRSEPTEVISI